MIQKSLGARKQKYVNRISKIGQGYLFPEESYLFPGEIDLSLNHLRYLGTVNSKHNYIL